MITMVVAIIYRRRKDCQLPPGFNREECLLCMGIGTSPIFPFPLRSWAIRWTLFTRTRVTDHSLPPPAQHRIQTAGIQHRWPNHFESTVSFKCCVVQSLKYSECRSWGIVPSILEGKVPIRVLTRAHSFP